MELKDLRVLPGAGKDPKANLFKLGGKKKIAIKGGTMMIRAVRPHPLGWTPKLKPCLNLKPCKPETQQQGIVDENVSSEKRFPPF